MTENENTAIARELSQKFDFYFIALVFTILALSVQTASITKNYWQQIFEIYSWALLLISGLAGLSRLEWLPVAYRHRGAADIEEKNLEVFKKGMRGETIVDSDHKALSESEIIKAHQKLQKHLDKRQKELEKIEGPMDFKYSLHKWCFVFGIIFLIVSRAILNLGAK